MLLLLLLSLSKEKSGVALVFILPCGRLSGMCLCIYLWTAFCSLPESLTNSSQQAHKLKRSPSTRLVPISYTSYHLFFSATNPPALCGCDHRTFFKPFFFHFIFPKQTDLIIGCDWLLTELFVSHDSGCSYINVLVAVLQTAD